MTQYNTDVSNQKQINYAIQIQIDGVNGLFIPWSSFNQEERETELKRIDTLIETGCRFIRIGDDRFPVNRIVSYRGYDYIPAGTYFMTEVNEDDND